MFIDITVYFMLLLFDYYVVFILTLITVLLSKSTELVGYWTLNKYYYYY